MKICIVTVYDSINCGSFWQAFALGKYLETEGHTVFYYKRDKTGGASSSALKQIAKTILIAQRDGLSAAVSYSRSIKEFRRAQKAFRIISEKSKEFDTIDCFVLGSDTIWNLESPYFRKHTDIFWGGRFCSKRVISYAASMANTSVSMVKVQPSAIASLAELAAIAVRDRYTLGIISQFTDKSISLVCDPTVLLSRGTYSSLLKNRRPYKYLYIYIFDAVSPAMANEIRAFAEQNDLHVVNGADTNIPDYCTEGSVVSPGEFLTDMYYADFVITDTFHGTIFSILFNRQFAVIDRNKTKVREMLAETGLLSRMDKEDVVMELLPVKIDFTEPYKALSEIRRNSEAYLESSLE